MTKIQPQRLHYWLTYLLANCPDTKRHKSVWGHRSLSNEVESHQSQQTRISVDHQGNLRRRTCSRSCCTRGRSTWRNIFLSIIFVHFLNDQFLKKNWPTATSFAFFRSFQTNNTIFIKNQYEKRPSSIQNRDLNPWPLNYESSHITIRRGLPPMNNQLLLTNIFLPLWDQIFGTAKSFFFKNGPFPSSFSSFSSFQYSWQ